MLRTNEDRLIAGLPDEPGLDGPNHDDEAGGVCDERLTERYMRDNDAGWDRP